MALAAASGCLWALPQQGSLTIFKSHTALLYFVFFFCSYYLSHSSFSSSWFLIWAKIFFFPFICSVTGSNNPKSMGLWHWRSSTRERLQSDRKDTRLFAVDWSGFDAVICKYKSLGRSSNGFLVFFALGCKNSQLESSCLAYGYAVFLLTPSSFSCAPLLLPSPLQPLLFSPMQSPERPSAEYNYWFSYYLSTSCYSSWGFLRYFYFFAHLRARWLLLEEVTCPFMYHILIC